MWTGGTAENAYTEGGPLRTVRKVQEPRRPTGARQSSGLGGVGKLRELNATTFPKFSLKLKHRRLRYSPLVPSSPPSPP